MLAAESRDFEFPRKWIKALTLALSFASLILGAVLFQSSLGECGRQFSIWVRRASTEGLVFEATVWGGSLIAAIVSCGVAWRVLFRHRLWRVFLVLLLPGHIAAAWAVPTGIVNEHVRNLSGEECYPDWSDSLRVYLSFGWILSLVGWAIVVIVVSIRLARKFRHESEVKLEKVEAVLGELALISPDLLSEMRRRRGNACLRLWSAGNRERWAVVQSSGDRWFSVQTDGGFLQDYFEEETPDATARQLLRRYTMIASSYVRGDATPVSEGRLRLPVLRVHTPDGDVTLKRSIPATIKSLLSSRHRR